MIARTGIKRALCIVAVLLAAASAPQAQVGPVPGIVAIIPPAISPASITAVGSGTDSSSQSTYSFAVVSFGTAATNRYVACAAYVRNASTTFTVNSMAIGGVSATQVGSTASNTGASVQNSAALFMAAVPTGTSGTVSFVLSTSANRAALSCWALTGLVSATPTNTASSTANAPTASIGITGGGVAIGAVITGTSPFTSPSSTWSGLSKDFDLSIAGVNNASGASTSSATSQTLSITDTITNVVGSNSAGVFATFR